MKDLALSVTNLNGLLFTILDIFHILFNATPQHFNQNNLFTFLEFILNLIYYKYWPLYITPSLSTPLLLFLSLQISKLNIKIIIYCYHNHIHLLFLIIIVFGCNFIIQSQKKKYVFRLASNNRKHFVLLINNSKF